MPKDHRKQTGNVYAIHTIYGDCLVQVAGIREIRQDAEYVIRVFSKRYSVLPENIGETVSGRHDYTVEIGPIGWLLKTSPKNALHPNYSRELKMRGIADNRKTCATLVGKYDVPPDFAVPRYFKRANKCAWIPREQREPWPAMDQWYILFENPDKDACTPFCSITVFEWVTEHLKMRFGSDEWHPHFVGLGPGGVSDQSLILMLEDGFSLDMWLPSDFKWKNKEYFQPTEEWAQIMHEESERKRRQTERYRLQAIKREELKAQGKEFKFWKTETYKEFIRLVKE